LSTITNKNSKNDVEAPCRACWVMVQRQPRRARQTAHKVAIFFVMPCVCPSCDLPRCPVAGTMGHLDFVLCNRVAKREGVQRPHVLHFNWGQGNFCAVIDCVCTCRWLQAVAPAGELLPACGVIAPHAGYSYSVPTRNLLLSTDRHRFEIDTEIDTDIDTKCQTNSKSKS